MNESEGSRGNSVLVPSDKLKDMQARIAELEEQVTALHMGWDECSRDKKELERNLAEQQAISEAYRVAGNAILDRLTSSGFATVKPISHQEGDMVQYIHKLRDGAPGEELNNLLAKAKEEGRKDAVPEGWQVVPKEPTVAMREVLKDRFGGSFLRTKEIYKEMLAAAPSP